MFGIEEAEHITLSLHPLSQDNIASVVLKSKIVQAISTDKIQIGP